MPVNYNSKEIIKLHKRFDKKLLDQLHKGEVLPEYPTKTSESWMSIGYAMCRYESDRVCFKTNERLDVIAFQETINLAPPSDPMTSARIIYYKAVSNHFAAVLQQPDIKDTAMVDNEYLLLFDKGFEYRLTNRDHSMLYIYYFGNLIGMISPIYDDKE